MSISLLGWVIIASGIQSLFELTTNSIWELKNGIKPVYGLTKGIDIIIIVLALAVLNGSL